MMSTMSRADIQYISLTTDPSRYHHDTTQELIQANMRLTGSLDETRAKHRETECWNMALAVMLAVAVVLLVLTWAGYISIGRG